MVDSSIARGRRLLAMAFLVAGAAWLSPAAATLQESTPLAITHGPYLQLPGSTSMTIVWHTNRKCVSRVEYWADGATAGTGRVPANAMTAVSATHGLIDNDRTSHIVCLTGLRPGTTYLYRVVSREFQGYEKQHIVRFGETVSSDPSSFTTLDERKASISFSVMSDIHENAKRLDVMLAASDWNRESFVVFNGDMVNDFMNADQPFTGFLDISVARFARTIPFVYVRGNHDVRGRFARSLGDYFPTQNGHAYYSFDHGPVHFIVLDSGEDKVDAHEYYNGLVAFEPYRREQAAWLANDLRSPAARRARYRILLSHIPPRDGTPRTGTAEEGFAIEQVRECWEKLANTGGVDLWLSGHTHRYAHVAPSAGGNRYQLVIGAPDTSTRVDVSREKLVVTVKRETGETVDTIAIRARVPAPAR
jgi:predicted phosphodiesterase